MSLHTGFTSSLFRSLKLLFFSFTGLLISICLFCIQLAWTIPCSIRQCWHACSVLVSWWSGEKTGSMAIKDLAASATLRRDLECIQLLDGSKCYGLMVIKMHIVLVIQENMMFAAWLVRKCSCMKYTVCSTIILVVQWLGPHHKCGINPYPATKIPLLSKNFVRPRKNDNNLKTKRLYDAVRGIILKA